MKYRSLMFAALAVVATVASLFARAQNNVDAMRASQCGSGNVPDRTFSCKAFTVLDMGQPADKDILGNRVQTVVAHSLIGDMGLTYTRSRGMRAFGITKGSPQDGMWLIGLQRDAVISGSKPMVGIGYQTSLNW